jgi:hypothetical protein
MTNQELSPYVRDGCFSTNNFSCKIQDVIKLVENNEVLTVDTSIFFDKLNSDCWGEYINSKRIPIIPKKVLESREPIEHFNRILNADLSYPILIYYIGRRVCVIDGMHRIAKTKMLGLNQIFIKIVTPSQFGILKNLH